MELKALAFLLTDRCNASCGMCCFSCSPRNRALLDVSMVKDYIRQAAELGTVKSVSFSGGEAMLYYDQLRECVAFAKAYGLRSTLVSNGFWGADMEKGRAMLGGLVEDGLTDLSLSVDQFHQEFVPIEAVKNAMALAEEFHVLSAITLMDLKDGLKRRKLHAGAKAARLRQESDRLPGFSGGRGGQKHPRRPVHQGLRRGNGAMPV